MAIFNSYVKLPEGTWQISEFPSRMQRFWLCNRQRDAEQRKKKKLKRIKDG
jgi:hypothetical protein